MLKAGIVGLPNVGKSTLFNALVANAQAEAANYPFCTIEPNSGVVSVPDPRLDQLAALSSSKEIIATRVEFVDIAGLVKGASQGEGLGNKFLALVDGEPACFTFLGMSATHGFCATDHQKLHRNDLLKHSYGHWLLFKSES